MRILGKRGLGPRVCQPCLNPGALGAREENTRHHTLTTDFTFPPKDGVPRFSSPNKKSKLSVGIKPWPNE